MCMIECCDEFSVVMGACFRKARKPHTCGECRRAIEPGERYYREALLDGRSPHEHRTCAHCMVVRDWLLAECRGFVYEFIGEDINEHVEEGIYGTGVKLLAIGMSRKWRRVDGRPWPVPRIPKTTHQIMATKNQELLQ